MATAKKTNTTAAKKTSPKKVSKKSTPAKKKTAKKTSGGGKKALICANGQECFWTTDGQILKDLTELRDALKTMADDVFKEHVTKDKNDFAEWVEHVLQDVDCAAALRKSKKPNTARTVVVRHLKFYQL